MLFSSSTGSRHLVYSYLYFDEEYVIIIIFTAVTDKSTKLEGLGLDIDDYLTKPADEDEIVARVKLLLKRSKQKMDCNPLTRLSGNPSIQARVEAEIASGKPFAVLYCDLNNFKSFNDHYGFEAGDRVLKTEADIITRAAAKHTGTFVGHIGGDDFIVVCPFESAEKIAREITEQLRQQVTVPQVAQL